MIDEPGPPPHADASTAALFTRLADLVYAGGSYDLTYAALCDAAPQLVGACDHASLMLRRGQEFVTVAANDEVARRVDELEREVGAGPCVDAIVDEAYQLDSDLTGANQWPMLAEQVLAHTPVRGMAGFRLLVGDAKVGALNLFCDTPGAFTRDDADQGTVLAAFASVALAAAEQRQQAQTLREGLMSNREIGKAVGLLMAGHKVGSDEAFGILRKTSQDMNLKIAVVAREIVDYHDHR